MNIKWLTKANTAFIMKCIILFGLEFNVRISGVLSLRKIVFLFILLNFIHKICKARNRIYFLKTNIGEFLLLTALLLYVLYVFFYRTIPLGNLTQGDLYKPSRVPVTILYLLIFPAMLRHYFISGVEFCRAQWYIVIFQASIAVLGKLNHTFSLWVYNHLYIDDGRLYSEVMGGTRVVCIDAAGATASVIFFAGFICAVYLFYNDKRCRQRILLAQYCYVMFSLFFIGRTGLYLGIILLFFVSLDLFIKQKRLIIWLSGLAVFGMLLIIGYVLFAPDSYSKSHYIGWIGELFIKGIGEGSTFDIIAKMEIPKLTQETFWGTGLVYGVTESGVEIMHDSGYIRTYAALGIPGLILYYGAIYGYYLTNLLHIRDKRNSLILLFFLLGVALCEYKEPFMGKTPLLIIMSVMFIMERDKRRQAEEFVI